MFSNVCQKGYSILHAPCDSSSLMSGSLISLLTTFSMIVTCTTCYLKQTLVKENHGGSEIVVVVQIPMLEERTGERRNGRMRTGRK